METRVAVLSIIVENEDAVSELNELLHRIGKFIIGRMGLPYRQKNVNIICIAIDAPRSMDIRRSKVQEAMGEVPECIRQVRRQNAPKGPSYHRTRVLR